MTLEQLTEEVVRLRERVDALERRSGDDGGVDFHLLDRLRAVESSSDEPGPVVGGLTYAGSLNMDGTPVMWQRNHVASALMADRADARAPLLAAAGHPVRLALLKRLMVGPADGPDLVATLGLTSTGKLYHHVDKLMAVGWIRQAGRGTWELAAEKRVPTLLLLGLVDDLLG